MPGGSILEAGFLFSARYLFNAASRGHILVYYLDCTAYSDTIFLFWTDFFFAFGASTWRSGLLQMLQGPGYQMLRIQSCCFPSILFEFAIFGHSGHKVVHDGKVSLGGPTGRLSVVIG